ncbi:MAG: hypothetical protein ABSG81_08725 [Acidimicrobiales bacterium]
MALVDERAFLLASLEDLEREHAVGDVTEQDYTALRDRYTQRAAEVLRALDDSDTAAGTDDLGATAATPAAQRQPDPQGASPTTRTPRRRRALAVGGVTLLLVALALVMVLRQSGARLPGASATGSVTLSKAQKEHQTLLQAETLEASGDGAQALTLYQQVLALDPTQNEALAESGWLEFEAGVTAKNPAVLDSAQQLEERAESEDPGAYAPHLYLGSMLLTEGNPTQAVTQYRLFLGDRPPTANVEAAEVFIVRAFTDAGQPVPSLPGRPAASSATG